MSETFYRKYRPQKFAEVVGQKHVVTTLQNALKLGRVGHAYLFTGPRGTGKTTLARILAKAVNCLDRKNNDTEPCGRCDHCRLFAEGRSMDVIEIDAASHTGVDNIRELRETVALPPTLGSHKIYIIDEVHMLSQGAFNALLKTLEEPPAHVMFILATTALHKVPDTILSRTQRFDLSRFPVQNIAEKLKKIAKKEKIASDDAALEMIALSAEGGMRDAESLFMQVSNLADGQVTQETVSEVLGTTTKESVFRLLELIGQRKLSESVLFVRHLSQEGKDLAIFGGSLLSLLRDLLFVSLAKESLETLEGYTIEHKDRLLAGASLFTPDEVVHMIEHFQKATLDTKTAFIEELPLEIAIVKILSRNTQPPSRESAPDSPASGNADVSKMTSPLPQEKKENQGAPKKPQTALKEEVAVDAQKVRDLWPQVLDEVKRRNASISVALSQSRFIEAEGTTLILGVKYSFHKERLEDKNYQATLLEAFDTILGQKVRLQIILEPKSSEAREAGVSSETHPLLNQALEMLGGRIVTES